MYPFIWQDEYESIDGTQDTVRFKTIKKTTNATASKPNGMITVTHSWLLVHEWFVLNVKITLV